MITIITEGTGLKDFMKSLQNRAQESEQIAKMNIKIVSDAEYSGYVDHGTSNMSAQPFFQETLEAHDPSTEIQPPVTVDKVRQYARNIASEMSNKAPKDTGYLASQISVQG